MKQARCLWDPDVRPCVRYCNGCEDLVWENQPLAGAGFSQPRKPQQVSSIDLTSRKKTCPHCGEEKLLTEFSRNAASHDGRQAWCKVCSYENTKAARKRKRGKVSA